MARRRGYGFHHELAVISRHRRREITAGSAEGSAEGRLPVDLAGEDGAGSNQTVEEEQAVEVVELVEERARLEGVYLQDAAAAVARSATSDEAGGAGDVAGEIRHAHASLAG